MTLIDAIHVVLLVLVVLACLGIAQRVVYRWEQQREWRRKSTQRSVLR